jgi:hypothetical protein
MDDGPRSSVSADPDPRASTSQREGDRGHREREDHRHWRGQTEQNQGSQNGERRGERRFEDAVRTAGARDQETRKRKSEQHAKPNEAQRHGARYLPFVHRAEIDAQPQPYEYGGGHRGDDHVTAEVCGLRTRGRRPDAIGCL